MKAPQHKSARSCASHLFRLFQTSTIVQSLKPKVQSLFGQSDIGLWTLDSPIFSHQIVLRNFVKQSAARVSKRIVYEADVHTPAGSPFVNLAEFRLPLLRSRDLTKVV